MKMAVVSMEMPSGGNSPSRRRAGTETYVPRILASRWRRLWNFSRIVAYLFRVFEAERIYRRKGSLGGARGWPPHRLARPPLAAPPCGVGPPGHPSGPSLALWKLP